MRGWIVMLALAVPVLASADGDPKSMAPSMPPPPAVEAAPTPPPAPIVEAAPSTPVEVAPAPVAAAPAPYEGFGSDTRNWLALQIGGTQSVTELRPIPGDVAERTYQRYLKSFDHPIPETFKRDSFGTSGGGSSSSTASTR